MVKRTIFIFALLLSLPSPVIAGFSDGLSAFRAGNYSDAFHEWQPLAELGHAKAQTNLALLYSRGLGVDRNPEEAVSWYRRAAEQNFAVAQYNLGVLFSRGMGVVRDEGVAMQWYLRAAEQGHVRAQFLAGKYYAEGIGVDRDDLRARDWLARAADRAKGRLRDKILEYARDVEIRLSSERTAPAQRPDAGSS